MYWHIGSFVVAGYFLLGASVITAVAGDRAPDSGGPESELVESETLKAELSKLVADTLKSARDAGETVPEGTDAKELTARIIRDTRKYQPTFLRVRPEVERRWKKGEFAEATAKARIQSACATLAEFKVALPNMHRLVIEQYQAKTLSGVRLELAAGLLEAEVAHFEKALKD